MGYIIGVMTTLYIFPPNSREIEMQEMDSDMNPEKVTQAEDSQFDPQLSSS